MVVLLAAETDCRRPADRCGGRCAVGVAERRARPNRRGGRWGRAGTARRVPDLVAAAEITVRRRRAVHPHVGDALRRARRCPAHPRPPHHVGGRGLSGRRPLGRCPAGFLTRAVPAAVVLLALGNLVVLGCLVGWLRILDPASPFHSAWWLMVSAAVCYFLSGATFLFAWAWSK